MAQFPQNQSLTPQIMGCAGGIANYWQDADASLTRPNNATAYAAHVGMGSGSSCLFTFSNLFRAFGSTGLLVAMRLSASVASIATTNMGSIRAHLFNAAPSGAPASDQATFNTLIANQASKVGFVDFSTWNIGGAGSDMIESYGTPILTPMPVQAASNSKSLLAILEATGAFTPIASAILLPSVSVVLD